MVSFDYKKTALVSDEQIKKELETLTPEWENLRQAFEKQYESEYASLYCPFDQEMIATIKQLVSSKRKLNPSLLVVIGIGGSNLGTKAIMDALEVRGIEVLFVDTVDPDKLHRMMLQMDKLLDTGHQVLINVITKSGTTTETVANFKILYSLLKMYRPDDYRDYIVVTTGKESPLAQMANDEKFDLLIIPEQVGGRYSVFSAVGLFPLFMANIDIDKLLIGAQQAVNASLAQVESIASVSAILLYENWKQGSAVHDFFLFVTRLQFLGKWYRQLMGESIGKENAQGKAVGIIPMTSIGSVDLHSVAQLYLAGPHNIYTSFVVVNEFDHHVKVPSTVLPQLDPIVNGKYLTEIMHAISQGTQEAYSDRSNPFCKYTFPAINAENIGAFMQIQMIQMMFLGKLLQVNPFNQPNVELYKIRTRNILG